MDDDKLFFTILKLIKDSNGIGASKVQKGLIGHGIKVSQSSVGRYLKEMENDGYIKKNDHKGRILTKKGYEAILKRETIDEYSTVQNAFIELLNKTGNQKMLDYLNVRKTIETEAIRLAAVKITYDELDKIECIMRKQLTLYNKYGNKIQNNEIPQSMGDLDCEFHFNIVQASKNKYLEKFFLMLEMSSRTQELYACVSGLKIEEHINIFEQLKKRNVQKSVECMAQHIDNVIEGCKTYWKTKEIIEKYLRTSK